MAAPAPIRPKVASVAVLHDEAFEALWRGDWKKAAVRLRQYRFATGCEYPSLSLAISNRLQSERIRGIDTAPRCYPQGPFTLEARALRYAIRGELA